MLTKKQLKLLGFMAKTINKEYSFSDLKKALKEKSHSSLQKSLSVFLNENLVSSRTIGTSKLYRLNTKNDKLFDYITIYNKESLPEKARISLEYIKEELKDQIFFSLIIFGSYADTSFKKNSDLDIAIIIPINEKKNVFESALNKASNKSLLNLDFHVFSKNEFQELLSKNYENVAKEIATKNLPISGTESFYKILLTHHI